MYKYIVTVIAVAGGGGGDTVPMLCSHKTEEIDSETD